MHSDAAARLLPRREADDDTSRPGAAMGRRCDDPQVEYLSYGPPLPDGSSIEVPSTYGSVELEYAAVRSGAGIMHRPERVTIRVRGGDRIEFLNRMLTQELKGMMPGDVRRAFWLNRKGRVEGDLLLLERDEEILIDVDRHDITNVIETLDAFLFADDVELEDASEDFERMTLLGPDASGCVLKDTIIAAQANHTAMSSLELFVPADEAASHWAKLLESCRPVGWFAFNIARIEAGIPQMHIDFNSEHLPHESGLLRERVSFTKGCYLGQEIVARMESRGRPKQTVVGLKIESESLPVEGTQVFEQTADGSPETPIGAVTSSTLSPMLGAQPIALAMVRSKFAQTGARLQMFIDGQATLAVVVDRPFISTAGDGQTKP